MKKLIIATLLLMTTNLFAQDKCQKLAERLAVNAVKKDMRESGHDVNGFDITHMRTRLQRSVNTSYAINKTYESKVKVFDRVEIAAIYTVVLKVNDGYPFCSLDEITRIDSDME
jgi:hypothetical protein